MWSRLLAVLLASCCLLVFPAPANADVRALRDDRRDVWRTIPGGEVAPARWSETGDVTRVLVSHRRAKIVVRISFVQLRRSGVYAQYAVRVQRSGERRWIREVLVEAGPGNWQGKVRAFNGRGELARGCDVRHRIDYRRDVVVVRLARACLNRPGAVRVNVNAYRATRKGVFLSDSAHTDQAHSRAWSDWVKRTR